MSNARLTLGARLYLRYILKALAFVQDILCMPGRDSERIDSACAASATKLGRISSEISQILAADDAEHLAALPSVTNVSAGSSTKNGRDDGESLDNGTADSDELGRGRQELRSGPGGAEGKLTAGAIALLRVTTKKPPRRKATRRRKPRKRRSR